MKKKYYGYYYCLPAIVFMLAFVGYPIIYNIILSFQNCDIMSFNSNTNVFNNGLNYKNVINNPLFTTALGQTFFFTFFCIVFQFVFGLLFALFFNLKFRLAEPIRGLVLVSWMIPLTVTGMLFKFMLSPSSGVINYLMLSLHLIKEPIGWLVDENLALWSIIITNTWVGIPFNMILLSTSMSTIPAELYESASIDGANSFVKLIKITLPMIKPAIMSMLMLGLIYTFKVFDLIFVMTGGGPVNSTEVLSTVSYRLSFNQFNFGQGAATANILFVILLIISLGYLKMLNKEEI
ncbi:MAG: sugar ABC transporter permease [Spirochaetia bacterium]|nr:sugar ABC transporter permease [Spirochaetia bacterium]